MRRVPDLLAAGFGALVLFLPAAALAQAPPASAGTGKAAPAPLTAEQLARSDASLEAHRTRLLAAASPATRAKLRPGVERVLQRAATTRKANEAPLDLLAEARTGVKSSMGGLPALELEALSYLVLMEAAKSAREDLKAIMANVKAIHDAKKCVRESKCLDAVAGRNGISNATKDAIAGVKSGGSLNEMGEMWQLRLQASMDRQSKMMSTLSNLLAKISSTQQSVIANIK